MKILPYILFLVTALASTQSSVGQNIKADCAQPAIPILTGKSHNQALMIRLVRMDKRSYNLNGVTISLDASAGLNSVRSATLYNEGSKMTIDTLRPFACAASVGSRLTFAGNQRVDKDTLVMWLSLELNGKIDLRQTITAACTQIATDAGMITDIARSGASYQRVGVALRRSMDYNVKSYRIPGLATSNDGTLLAIYDIRRDTHRDLQGDIDIGLSRSADGGVTWSPMQTIMDRGRWGGLPEKFNGISDAAVLVDTNSGTIFVAALWMYGLLDKETGKWIKGLDESSKEHNHQWKNRGSQSGYGVKRTSQFLITKSSDDGLTWSEPINITRSKRRQWWLYAPAPGRGITLSDGKLVFPSQGRDKNGLAFSNITWSDDAGKSWKASRAAYTDVTECAAVELSDGSIMLNMRDNRNRGKVESNGRRICTTTDMGESWTEHHTSRKALIEPTCMGSIHRHQYTTNGQKKSVLLFANPHAISVRNNITLKMSFDDGNSWPEQYWILLDERIGRGYSCITSVDPGTIGIIYEGSQADMTFQQIDLTPYLK